MRKFLKMDIFGQRKWLGPVVALVLVFMSAGFLLFLVLAALSGVLIYRNGLAPHLNATLNRDIAYYQEYRKDKVVFPAEISATMTVNDYFFLDASEKYIGENSCNLYLDVTYSNEEYENEVKRLNDYKVVRVIESSMANGEIAPILTEVTGYLLFDEHCEYFNFPTYIADYDHEGHYEYAMLTGENRIVYVYISLMRDEDLRMSKYYRPIHYEKDTFESEQNVCYSVYDAQEIYNFYDPNKYVPNREVWTIVDERITVESKNI